jgi:hypothetical protein
MNTLQNPYLQEMKRAPELWRNDAVGERKKWLSEYESLYSQIREIAATLDPVKDKKSYVEMYDTVLPQIREAIQYLKDFDYKQDVTHIGKEQKNEKTIQVTPPVRIPSPKAVKPMVPAQPSTIEIVNPYDEAEEKKDHFYEFGTRLHVDDRATNWKIGSIVFLALFVIALIVVAVSLLKVVIF